MRVGWLGPFLDDRPALFFLYLLLKLI
jgi:hypothetical protein